MILDHAMPILAVDDFSTTNRIISGLLKQIGFHAIDAASGREGTHAASAA